MTLPIIIAIVVVALALVAVAATRRRSQREAVAVATDTPQWPDDGSEAHVVPRDPKILWPSRVDPRSATLDDDARLALIKDLGFIRASWVVPILTQASAEEQNPSHRDAIQQALSACGHPDGPGAAA